MKPGRAWQGVGATAFAAACGVTMMLGCAGDTVGSKPVPTQPVDVVASRMSISAALPQDTDLNGYPDTIDMTIFVFDDRYPIPIDVPGAFTFKLSGGKDGRVIRQWGLPPEKVAAGRRRMPAGPGYVFSLSMVENGGDKIEAQHVDLTADFAPINGPMVKMRGGSTLRLGKLTQ